MRGLKITMGVFGAILVLEGVLDLALPMERAVGLGLGQCASHAQLAMAVLGATWVVAGGWTIAAARNPARHIGWVKFALTLSLALGVALSVQALRGYVAFGQVASDIGFDALFVGLFIAFFPRRARGEHSSSERPPHAH